MEEPQKIGIYSRHVLLFTEKVPIHGLVVIQGEFISEIRHFGSDYVLDPNEFPNVSILSFEDDYVCPGVVDLNVVINRQWEGYTSITKAAASGGTTFLLETQSDFTLPTDDELYCDVGYA